MNLPIPRDEIHLFLIEMAEVRPYLAVLRPFLSVEEVVRSERYFQEADRERSVASRGILRVMLSAYTGWEAGRLSLAQNPAGKPGLARVRRDELAFPEDEDWQFNVSHSGEFLLFGITVGREVGVDIEQIREIEVQAVVSRFFHRDEIAWLNEQPDMLGAFYALWSGKEAVIKAMGLGLQFELPAFAVKCGTAWAPARFDGVVSQGWAVCSLRAPAKYRAAVACGWPVDVVAPRVQWLSSRVLLERLKRAV